MSIGLDIICSKKHLADRHFSNTAKNQLFGWQSTPSVLAMCLLAKCFYTKRRGAINRWLPNFQRSHNRKDLIGQSLFSLMNSFVFKSNYNLGRLGASNLLLCHLDKLECLSLSSQFYPSVMKFIHIVIVFWWKHLQ